MAGRKESACVRCGLEQGYHRAVVDTTTDAEIGSLCRDCESAAFEGHVGLDDDTTTCAFCERDGFFALPMWVPVEECRGDVIVYATEYEVTDDTVHLCDEHYITLVEGGSATAPDARPRPDHR